MTRVLRKRLGKNQASFSRRIVSKACIMQPVKENIRSQIQFGKNIRIARSRIGLTQKQVADKAKMHVNYYARIERGEENPSYEVLEKLIKALGVKPSKVLPF